MPKNSSTAWLSERQVQIESAASIAEIPAASWNRLHGTHYPFLRHEYLLALEASGCVCSATGWTPCHLIVRNGQGMLVGAMPLYRKTNSFGEFVFDWAWADAYERHVCFHTDVRAAFAECCAWGFVDVFRKHHPEPGHFTFFDYRTPNAVRRGLGWRLDYVLASPALGVR